MIESCRVRHKTNSLSDIENQFMFKQRELGFSYGAIGEKLYDEFGYTLNPRDIQRILKKQREKGV